MPSLHNHITIEKGGTSKGELAKGVSVRASDISGLHKEFLFWGGRDISPSWKFNVFG